MTDEQEVAGAHDVNGAQGATSEQAATAAQGATGEQGARLTTWVTGQVQGVGFRWWVRVRALELGLTGCAENLADGRVRVIAEGNTRDCRALLSLLRGPGTPGRVTGVTERWGPRQGGLSGFAGQ